MALCRVTIFSMGALNGLVFAVEEGIFDPHEIIVPSMDAIINAPHYLNAVQELERKNWRCGQTGRIATVEELYKHLRDLSNDVLPKILKDLTCGKLLVRLHSSGKAIGRFSQQHCVSSMPALRILARTISDSIKTCTVPVLGTSGKKVLVPDSFSNNIQDKKVQVPDGFSNSIQRLETQIKDALLDPIDLGGIPTVRIHSLMELKALGPVEEAQELQIVCIDAAHHAPAYLKLLQTLTAPAGGWTSYQEEAVLASAEFVELALKIRDKTLPKVLRELGVAMVRRLGKQASEMDSLAHSAAAPRALVDLADSLYGIRREVDSFVKHKRKDRARWADKIRVLVQAMMSKKIRMD